MAEIWIPIVSAILAALLGAFINDRLRRPRLRVIPTSLRLTTDIIPRGSVVVPNAELLNTCSEQSMYTSTPPFLAVGKVDELEYVTYLTSTLALAQQYVRVTFPAIAKRAQELQVKLGADDLEGVARIWQREQAQLWPAIEGPYVRREFELDPPPDDDLSPGAVYNYELTEQPDGAVFVLQQGPPYIGLVFTPVSRLGAAGSRSRELARRLGTAFGQGIKPDLIKVFNFLARIDREIPALDNLSRSIEAELTRLKRLTVTALISNAGGTPVSISKPRCEMEMHVRGYPYNVGPADDAKQVVERDDRTIELLLVDDEGKPLPPLVVEAGGVSAVTGVYREPLSAEPLAEGGSLYDLVRSSVEGSERTWKLSMEAVLPRDPSKIIESRNTAFKDLKEHEQVESFAPREQTNASLGQQLAARDNELSAARAELNAVRQQVTVLESAQTQFLAFLAHSGAQPDEPERAASTVADDTASEHDGSSGSVAS